jgi:hypothetical protein
MNAKKTSTAVCPMPAAVGRFCQCRFAPDTTKPPAHHQHDERCDLDDGKDQRQARARTRAADVHGGEDAVDREDHGDAKRASAKRRHERRERVHQKVADRRARHDGVRRPHERADNATDDRTEGDRGVGVETAGAVDPAADLGEAQPDETDQQRAHQIREYRRRAEHARGDPRQTENARSDDAVEGGGGKRAGAYDTFEVRPGPFVRARDVIHRDNPSTDELAASAGGLTSMRTEPRLSVGR